MTKKIFRSMVAVAMTVLLASLVIAVSFLYEYYNRMQTDQLRKELSAVAEHVEEAGAEAFACFDSSVFRFTWVAADGTVLYDTQAAAPEMENHLEREEIQEALETGKGSSTRYSATFTEKTRYEAVLLDNGTVLRISVNRMTAGALFLGMLPAITAIVLTAIAVSLLLSNRMTKSIVKPLNELDLEHPTENDIYEELAPMLTKIHKQHGQIKKQMEEIRQKADELEQITASMNEGLILLDQKGMLIGINPAAKKLFGMEEAPVGRDFLTVDRSAEMSRAIGDAVAGKHSEFREQRNGGEYQFIINRIESDSKTIGVVILCFDVTESAFAERNRQEFTANVSHELKTPLQSIIGSAELLENGLVKPEDTQRFVGNIKNEATRLVSLINDIIRLSQLDENSDSETEPVDLYDLAGEAVGILAESAAKRRVSLFLNGESCIVNGNRRYLYEIVYNLCDNAIRYNKEDGKVTVNVRKVNGTVVLTVSDTGIGIPAEHQSRIFERFYRVDKSHSKETGGTGLGLSIVKHAVAFHGGSIQLDSAEGKGTAVTVRFP